MITSNGSGLDLYKISSSVQLAEQMTIQAGNMDPLSTKCEKKGRQATTI